MNDFYIVDSVTPVLLGVIKSFDWMNIQKLHLYEK